MKNITFQKQPHRITRAAARLLGALAITAAMHCAQAQQATPDSGGADATLPANAGTNLALNKTYVCSDPNLYNWDKGLTDGSWEENSVHTFATGNKPTFPKTVTVDLVKAADISLVRLGVPAFGSTKTIAVSVSTDGTTFKEVGAYVFSQNKTEKHLYSFPATLTRYVRLTYPDHYDAVAGPYGVNFVFTTELEVYAPGK